MNQHGCRLCGVNDTITHLRTTEHRLRAALAHVTGVAPDSSQHYWPSSCDGCKEAAALIGENSPSSVTSPTLAAHVAAVLLTAPQPCQRCGGEGSFLHKDGRAEVTARVTCPACHGSGKQPPLTDALAKAHPSYSNSGVTPTEKAGER